jgi:hypothetical protein
MVSTLNRLKKAQWMKSFLFGGWRDVTLAWNTLDFPPYGRIKRDTREWGQAPSAKAKRATSMESKAWQASFLVHSFKSRRACFVAPERYLLI